MSDNAKLRTLRDKMLDCAKLWRGHEKTNPTDAAYWSGRVWVAEYAVQCLDSLLAEPEPLADACKAPSGCCVAITSTEGSWCPQGCIPANGRHAWRNARGVLRRETVEEEIARLYGHEGRP